MRGMASSYPQYSFFSHQIAVYPITTPVLILLPSLSTLGQEKGYLRPGLYVSLLGRRVIDLCLVFGGGNLIVAGTRPRRLPGSVMLVRCSLELACLPVATATEFCMWQAGDLLCKISLVIH